LIIEAILSSIIGAYLCSMLGYYISRIGLSTLAFTIAHAALAGAATALVLGLDMTYLAIVFSITTAFILGLLYNKLSHTIDSICMTLFSFFNAVALLAIYYSNTTVLATASISAVLWGSVLAVTLDKLVVLIGVAVLYIVYTIAYRKHIDSLLFDKKLAEAEGINTRLHTIILLVIASTSISIVLRIIGGFLVFTLLYIPSALASTLELNTRQQHIAIPVFGSASAATGLWISLLLDLPVGVSIALTTVLMAAVIATVRTIAVKIMYKYKR